MKSLPLSLCTGQIAQIRRRVKGASWLGSRRVIIVFSFLPLAWRFDMHAQSSLFIPIRFRGDGQLSRHLECCKRSEPAGIWTGAGPPNTTERLRQPGSIARSHGETSRFFLFLRRHSLFRGQQRSKVVIHFRLQDSYTPHSVLAADVSRGLPPMSTFHRNSMAPHTTDNSNSERNQHSSLFILVYGVSFFLMLVCCFCLFQSQGATEMHQERRRQATLWAKRWPQ